MGGTSPALSDEARREYPLPSTDAKILNVSQGDEIVIADDGVFSLKVEVKALFMTVWCPDSRSVESNCGIPRG